MHVDLSLDKDFEIQIGPHTWQVHVVELNGGVSDGHVWGLCDSVKQVIYIDKNASYSMRLSTFLHEVFHAFETNYDINIQHRDINLMGDALAQVLTGLLVCTTPKGKKTKK